MVDGYITARSCAVRVSVVANDFYNSTTTECNSTTTECNSMTTEWHILIERRFEGTSYMTNLQGPSTSHS